MGGIGGRWLVGREARLIDDYKRHTGDGERERERERNCGSKNELAIFLSVSMAEQREKNDHRVRPVLTLKIVKDGLSSVVAGRFFHSRIQKRSTRVESRQADAKKKKKKG